MNNQNFLIISMACILLFGCGRTSMWDRLEKTRTDVKEALDDLSAEEAAIIAAWHASPRSSRTPSVQSHQQLLLKYPDRMLEDALKSSVIGDYFGGSVGKYFIGMTFGAEVPSGVRLDRGLMDGVRAFNRSFAEFPSGIHPVLLLNPAGLVAYGFGSSLVQNGKAMASNYSKAAIGLAAEKLGDHLLKHRDQISEAVVKSVTDWLRSEAGTEYTKELIREGIDRMNENAFNFGFQFSLGSFLANTLTSELFSLVGSFFGIRDRNEEMLRYLADSIVKIHQTLSALVVQVSQNDRHVSILEDKTLSIPILEAFHAIEGRETDLKIYLKAGQKDRAAQMANMFLTSGVLHEMVSNILTFSRERTAAARNNHLKDIAPEEFHYNVEVQKAGSQCRKCACVFGICLMCGGPLCGYDSWPSIWESRQFTFAYDIGPISVTDYTLLLRVVAAKFLFIEVAYGDDPGLCARLKAENARVFRSIFLQLSDELNESFAKYVLDVRDAYATDRYDGLTNTTPETLKSDLDGFILTGFDHVARLQASIDHMLVYFQGHIIAAEEYE